MCHSLILCHTTNFQVKPYDLPYFFVTKMRHDLHGFLPRAVRGLRERGGVNVPNSNVMRPGMMVYDDDIGHLYPFIIIYMTSFGFYIFHVILGP